MVCLFELVIISAQVTSSGKVSVVINNKPKPEVKQNKPFVSEQNNIDVQIVVKNSSKV